MCSGKHTVRSDNDEGEGYKSILRLIGTLEQD